MKRGYTTNLDLQKTDLGFLLLRLAAGGLMLTHGFPKLLKLFGNEPISFGDPIGIGVEASLTLTVFAEFVCAVFLVVGLGTRLVLLPLFVTMAVAFFIVHGADPFQQKELSLLYMLLYLVLFLTGPGKYSLDYYLMRKHQANK